MTCPTCNSEQNLSLRNNVSILPRRNFRLKLMVCLFCNHTFFYTSQEDQRIIEESYNDEYKGYRKDFVFEKNLKVICTRVLDGFKGKLKILDVGCGRGDFLDLARDLGYEGFGIDVSDSAKKICLSRGLKAVSGDFLDYQFDQKFDVITFWDVIEHLQYPSDFIKRAERLLSPDGVIVIKVPHFSRISILLASRFPLMARVLLGAPDHIQFYSKNSLKILAERAGLHDVGIERMGNLRGLIPNQNVLYKGKKMLISFSKKLFGDSNYLVVLRKKKKQWKHITISVQN